MTMPAKTSTSANFARNDGLPNGQHSYFRVQHKLDVPINRNWEKERHAPDEEGANNGFVNGEMSCRYGCERRDGVRFGVSLDATLSATESFRSVCAAEDPIPMPMTSAARPNNSVGSALPMPEFGVMAGVSRPLARSCLPISDDQNSS